MLFLHDTENTKRIFSQDLKLEKENPGTFLYISYCFIKPHWKNFEKDKEIFLSPEYADVGSKSLEFGKSISKYFRVV